MRSFLQIRSNKSLKGSLIEINLFCKARWIFWTVGISTQIPIVPPVDSFNLKYRIYGGTLAREIKTIVKDKHESWSRVAPVLFTKNWILTLSVFDAKSKSVFGRIFLLSCKKAEWDFDWRNQTCRHRETGVWKRRNLYYCLFVEVSDCQGVDESIGSIFTFSVKPIILDSYSLMWRLRLRKWCQKPCLKCRKDKFKIGCFFRVFEILVHTHFRGDALGRPLSDHDFCIFRLNKIFVDIYDIDFGSKWTHHPSKE